MDPNEALRRIRESVNQLLYKDTDDERITALVEHVQALDEWLSKGGFLPNAWVDTSGPWQRPDAEANDDANLAEHTALILGAEPPESAP